MIISCSCLGQTKHDRINIYAIHVETDFAADNIDANYIRVNSIYKFSSTDKVYIERVYVYFLNKKDNSSYDLKDISSGIRLVIDFIKAEQRISYIVMNSSYTFFMSTNFGESEFQYDCDKIEISKIEEIVPFFKYIHY